MDKSIYCGRGNAVPYDELIGLYGTLHEADIQKSYDVLDAHLELDFE